jgi:hypothetical protein
MKRLALILAVLLAPNLSQASVLSGVEMFSGFQNSGNNRVGVSNVLQSIPETQHGMAFDLTEHKFSYLTTTSVAKKGNISLDAGFSTDNKAVSVLSYDLGGLQRLGIDSKLTNLINVKAGFYVGYARLTGDNEMSYGPTVTIISAKF